MLFLAACSSKPMVEPPADLIGEDTVVQLVAEQLVIESMVFNAPPEYNKDVLTRALYSQLFEKYNVTIPRYRSSLTYYFTDQKKMNDILTQAKARIDAHSAALPNQ